MQNKVKGPAFALIVLGVLGILGAIWGFISPTDPEVIRNALEQGNMDAEQVDMTIGFVSKFAVGINIVQLAMAGLLVFAGSQMLKLKSWGLAVTASIVAMIPCWCCCILGVPVGIWALIVLLDKDVKAAFQTPAAPPPL